MNTRTLFALSITVLSASVGQTAEVITVDFTSLSELPTDWKYAVKAPVVIPGQGLSVSGALVYTESLGTSEGWSIRTQAVLPQDFGILGPYVGEFGPGVNNTAWIGVVANGEVDGGRAAEQFDVGEVDFDPTEEFVLQLDTFDGRFRMWAWTPGNSPAVGADPLFDIPFQAPDSFPGIWSSPHGQGPGQSFDAIFRTAMFSSEHIALGLCGDFDQDNDVDAADRTIQTQNWTGALQLGDPDATKIFGQGDCDGDGDVDTADQTNTILNWSGATLAANIGNSVLQIGQTDADANHSPMIDLGLFPIGITNSQSTADVSFTGYANDLVKGGTLISMPIPEPSAAVLATLGLPLFWRRRTSSAN